MNSLYLLLSSISAIMFVVNVHDGEIEWVITFATFSIINAIFAVSE